MHRLNLISMLFLVFMFSVIAEESPSIKVDVVEKQKKVEEVDIKEPEKIELESVTIIGSEEERLRISGSAHALDEEDLSRYKYDDIHRVLSQVPGVYIREEDGYGLRPNIGFRGADSNRSKKVVLMEDGVLFGPAPYSAPAAYYFPMTSRMTGVEVFKGPSGIQYGPNTIGGAINLQTRPIPYEAEGALDLSYGADQYMKGLVHYGTRKGQWGYLVDLVHLRSDGYKELDNGEDTGFDKTEGMFKVQWESDIQAKYYQRVNLKLGYSEESSQETYLGLSDADFDRNPYRRYGISQDDEMNWDRYQYEISHLVDFNNGLELNTTAYLHDFSRSWAKVNNFGDGTEFLDVLDGTATNAAFYYDVLNGTADSGVLVPNLIYGDNQRDFVSKGIQTDGKWNFEDKFEQVLKFGLRYHHDEISRHHTEAIHQFISGEMTPIAGSTIDSRINKDETDAISVYLLHEIKINRWKFNPGLRMESMDMTSINGLTNTETRRDDFVLLPGLGLSYDINDNWVALAGVHQGFSPVTPGQVNSIEEEKSINYELGVRYEKQSFSAELIGFYNDYSNLLGEATLSTGATPASVGTQYNGGAVDVYGFELVLSEEIELSLGSMPIRLNYTYTDSEFKSTFGSSYYGYDRDLTDAVTDELVLAGDPLPYVPEHILQFDIGWHVNKWKLHLNSKYQSEMQEIASADETDDYWTFDFSGLYQWQDNKAAYLKVDNIFDESHIASRRPYGARPSKPRQWQLGFEYKI